MKNVFILLDIMIMFCVAMAQDVKIMRGNNLQNKRFEPVICAIPTLADLSVSNQKVVGQASGPYSEISGVENEAISNALGLDTLPINKADVLIGTNFFYEVSGDLVKVTVTGYPARYINFRPATESDTTFLKVYSPAKNKYEFYSVFKPSTSNEKLPNESPNEKSLYFSIKYQQTLPYSIAGGNLELGCFNNNFFFSGNFGGGSHDFGGGLSFGGRIQPVSWMQIIPGISTGFWVLYQWESDYDRFGYSNPYYGYNSYSYYSNYYGCWGNYYYKFAFGGPFVKLLFGKDKFWVEGSYRHLLGMKFASQVMAGFTYAPSKKSGQNQQQPTIEAIAPSERVSDVKYVGAVSPVQKQQQSVLEIAAQSESVLDGKFGDAASPNEKVLDGEYIDAAHPLELAAQNENVSGEDDAAHPLELAAELDGIITEINGKDYAKRKAKLEKFVANSQKTQDKLSSIRSVAPGCYDIASLALEMLKVTMDVTKQVEAEMSGYRKILGTSGGITDEVISEKRIPYETFDALIKKSLTLLATAPNLKSELTGPTAIVGAPMLGFATSVIPITTKQLTLMIKASKALRELKRAGI